MELRLYIPDSPRRAWQALRYFVSARRSPVMRFGVDDYRRLHTRLMAALGEMRAAEDRLAAQRAELIAVRKELSALKRRRGD